MIDLRSQVVRVMARPESDELILDCAVALLAEWPDKRLKEAFEQQNVLQVFQRIIDWWGMHGYDR